jgi:hypothetical protein
MIGLATTTITVRRVPGGPVDMDGPLPAAETVASGVRAHLSTPTGAERIIGGSMETVDRLLGSDPCDLDHADTVTDEGTGLVYTVVFAELSRGLGLDHMVAGLRRVTGQAA